MITQTHPPSLLPCLSHSPQAKRGGKGRGGGRGGGGGRGAGNAAPSEGGDGGGGRGRGGGRPSDAAVVKKLSERVSSGATSGVVVKNQAVALGGDGGNRDPLRGVDVASLDEISIAEGDWQRVFRWVWPGMCLCVLRFCVQMYVPGMCVFVGDFCVICVSTDLFVVCFYGCCVFCFVGVYLFLQYQLCFVCLAFVSILVYIY